MFNQPAVSVIVLIYNVEQPIEKCIESLYNQSLNSIEYIFIDDCSSDNSIALLKKLMDKYPERASNSIIIANESNQGQAKSRITGIRNAHGKYVAFCDSDDYVASNAYHDMYDYIESTKSDIVACNFYRVYNNLQNEELYLGNDTPHEWIKNILISKKMGALWCHLIKKTLFADLLCPQGNIMEDTVILTQCLLKSNKVSTYKKPLYYYYYRPDSITNKNDRVLEQAMHMRANLDIISALLKDYKPTLKKEIEYKFFFIKRWLFPIIYNAKDCQFWIDFKSGNNIKFLLNSYIGIKDKLSIILIYFRLYPSIKLLKK